MNTERITSLFTKYSPEKEMTEEEMEIFLLFQTSKDPDINADINKLDKESELYKHFKPLIMSFQGQILMKRLELSANIKMSLSALVMLLHYMPNAGAAVIHSLYIQNKLPENTLITLDVYTKQLFPWGNFSEEQLNNIWRELDDKELNETRGK
jgi:hypothetical protein